MERKLLDEIEENGLAVIDLLSDDEVEVFQQLIKQSDNNDFEFSGLSYSLMSENLAFKLNVLKQFEDVMQNKEVFKTGDWDFVSGSFLWKHPKMEKEFNLHQDWSYTEEKKYSKCYTMWIPLQDVDKNNGCIYVLPKSHKFFQSYRSASLDTARISLKDNPKLAGHIQTVPMKKGQALLFKQALFHGSHPNLTDKPRVCLTGILKDKNVPLFYYHQLNQCEVQKYKVGSSMFVKDLKEVSMGNIPNDFIPHEIITYRHELVDESILLNKLI